MWLIYNVVLISVVQQSYTIIYTQLYTYMCSFIFSPMGLKFLKMGGCFMGDKKSSREKRRNLSLLFFSSSLWNMCTDGLGCAWWRLGGRKVTAPVRWPWRQKVSTQCQRLLLRVSAWSLRSWLVRGLGENKQYTKRYPNLLLPVSTTDYGSP